MLNNRNEVISVLPIREFNGGYMKKTYNEMIEEQLNDIKSRVKLEHGDGKVPATYPEPFKTEWEKTYAKKKWSAEYPIDAGNIEDFAKFCLESGGFEIC